MPRTTEELQKDALFKKTIKFLSTVKLVREKDNFPMVKAISFVAELSASLRESDGWRKHYEKESEERGWRLESYGRRLNAVREAYYSEDVPPEFTTPPKKEDTK